MGDVPCVIKCVTSPLAVTLVAVAGRYYSMYPTTTHLSVCTGVHCANCVRAADSWR